MYYKFKNWLITKENKTHNTAYSYANAISKISTHYSSKMNATLDLYQVKGTKDLKYFTELYGVKGLFSKFGYLGNSTNRCALTALYRFHSYLESNQTSFPNKDYIIIPQENYNNNNIFNNFCYEKDLKNSILNQLHDLFPNYKIFRDENNGIEYPINGRKIDLLLEKKDGSLLIIELKTGTANYKAFGQISMYIGLLKDKYPGKNIYGKIISSTIDKKITSTLNSSDVIDAVTYKMKLHLDKSEPSNIK